MSRALVLNASYEPLSVVPVRRAVVLVLSEKAEVIHESGDVMRSERLVVAVPSVVRLRSYVRVPYRRVAALSRRGVFLRDGGVCQYCGRKADSIDHVVPRSRGGSHAWENVVAACGRCNSAKRDRLLEETSMRLRRRPQVPSPMSWVAVAVPRMPADWTRYLGLAGAIPA
ncbi:HNH endonuclease [Rhabdothermincola sediminis]|uniref:HNH endonuclease n=1 Tax=Rhabdothermincola sediminis TaxID=2751370 RepID=UPI001AA04A5A|nr:HNH endonuclease [Rhabdothermincola sediminis]